MTCKDLIIHLNYKEEYTILYHQGSWTTTKIEVCLFSVTLQWHSLRVFWLNLIGMTIMYSCVFLVGIASYAVYHGCDPTALGLITKKEEIVPFFVMHKASFIWGLPGLFIASLFSATLRSVCCLDPLTGGPSYYTNTIISYPVSWSKNHKRIHIVTANLII